MIYEYKWYIVKVGYSCSSNIQELVKSNPYFKEVFIPYEVGLSLKSSSSELCDVYVYMHFCDESKAILNSICGIELGDFEVISDYTIDFKRKECNKYRWYILRVASNHEEKVRQYILENSVRLGVSDYFKEITIPYEESDGKELKSKRKVGIRKKCFPGYVFLYMNLCDEVLNFVNHIPKSLKVYGFLKDDNVPKVISDNEITSMYGALCSVQESKKLSCGYEKGEKIKINDGSFQNFAGTVKMIDDENEIISVEVLIWGKPTLIELNLSQIEKMGD